MAHLIALFGESQKGDFKKAHFCETLAQLSSQIGEPSSAESKGVYFAIQALLYSYEVLFFRVHEEGFSINDYIRGLSILSQNEINSLAAIGLPGVGSHEILDATTPICQTHKSFLIVTEKDLYDYLTAK